MKRSCVKRSFRSRSIRGGLAGVLLLAIAWIILQFMLPFGNHLIATISFPKFVHGELISMQRIFISPAFSKWVIRITGYSCDAPVFSPDRTSVFRYLDFRNNSVGGAITLYEEVREDLNDRDKSRIRSMIMDLIKLCDPNLGEKSRPPLSDAILAEEEEFVRALLDRGADPLLKYQSGSGAALTPLRVAEFFAEQEAKRMWERPENGQTSIGKAQRIFVLISAHVSEKP